MDASEENRALVAFTTLAPLPVGGLVALLMIQGRPFPTQVDPAAVILLAVALLAMAASFLHLGRPLRAYRALGRVATSWLSREVALFGLFLLGLAVYSSLPWLDPSGQVRLPAGLAVALLGAVALLATGRLYRLRARPAWDHWATTFTFLVGALAAGLPLGVVVAGPANGTAAPTAAASMVAAVALLLAPALACLRSNDLRKGDEEGRATWLLIVGEYRWVLAVLIAADLLALALVLAGNWSTVWIAALLGELADRVLFFYTAVPVSFAARSGVPWVAGFAGQRGGSPSRQRAR